MLNMPEERYTQVRRMGITQLFSVILLLGLSYALFLACGSIFKWQYVTPDSYLYADMASNLLLGRGVALSSISFNNPLQFSSSVFFQPQTYFAPLFPILLAGCSFLGIEMSLALHLLPCVAGALLLSLWVCFVFTRYGLPDATLAAAVFVFSYPFFLITVYAWSEALALLFWSLGLFALCPSGERRPRALGYCLAGAFLGLAYAARSVFLLGIFLIPLQYLIFRRKPGAARVFWALPAWLGVALPLLVRNYIHSGSLLGEQRLPSVDSLCLNLGTAGNTLTGLLLDPEWVSGRWQQLTLAGLAVVLVLSILFVPRTRMDCARFVQDPLVLLLIIWAVVYAMLLVLYRSFVHIDPLGPRLLSPAALPIALVIALGIRRLTPLSERWIVIGAVMLIVFRIGALGREVYQEIPVIEPDLTNTNRWRGWVISNTDERDLIIADAGIDIPFYCGPRPVLAVFPRIPQNPVYLNLDRLDDFLARHRGEIDEVYFVLRLTQGRIFSREKAEEEFGKFLVALMLGENPAPARIRLEQTLDDAIVYRMIDGPSLKREL